MGKCDAFLVMKDGFKTCKECGQKFKEQNNSGTSQFFYHFTTKHPLIAEKLDLNRNKLKLAKRSLVNVDGQESNEEPPVKKRTPKISDAFNKWSPNSSHVAKIDKALVVWILSDDRPFSTVESESFKRFLHVLVPQFQVKSRGFYMKLLDMLYDEERSKIKNLLKDVKYISIGSDLWSSKSNQHQLIVITGHFLQNGRLITRILQCEPFSERHTGENIEKKIKDMIDYMEIESKLVGFVRDGASNLKKAARNLEIENYDCLAHKIHNSIMYGLKTMNAATIAIAKIQRIVKKIGRSSVDNSELKDIQKDCGLPDLALVKSMEVRWSSIFKMLDRILYLRSAVEIFLAGSSKYPRISTSEWSLITDLHEILKPLYEGTLRVQGRTETVSIILPLCKLYTTLLSESPLEEITDRMKEKLQEKYDDYQQSDLLNLATALDPRFKLRFCSEGTKALLLREAKQLKLPSVACAPIPKQTKETEHDPFSIFDEDPSETSTFILSAEDIDSQKDIEAEVEKYVAIPPDRSIDHFDYWHRDETEKAFPTLTELAKKLLTCPASSAESERAFSGAGRIASVLRRCITSDRLAKSVFLQQNYRLY